MTFQFFLYSEWAIVFERIQQFQIMTSMAHCDLQFKTWILGHSGYLTQRRITDVTPKILYQCLKNYKGSRAVTFKTYSQNLWGVSNERMEILPFPSTGTMVAGKHHDLSTVSSTIMSSEMILWPSVT